MTEKMQNTPAPEQADTEGHMPRIRVSATEVPTIDAESVAGSRHLTDEADTEGQGFRKHHGATEDVPEADGATATKHLTDEADTEGHERK